MPLFVHSFILAVKVLFPLTCRVGRRSINAYLRSEKSPLARAARAGLINLLNGWCALKCRDKRQKEEQLGRPLHALSKAECAKCVSLQRLNSNGTFR